MICSHISPPRFLFCTQPKHCVCSLFLTAAYGCSVDHTVNSTSPVHLHLLMRARVWLAESSSSARRGQSSLGREEIKSTVLHMKQSMDASLSVFFYKPSIWCYFVQPSASHHACTSVPCTIWYLCTSHCCFFLSFISFLLSLFHFCLFLFCFFLLPV